MKNIFSLICAGALFLNLAGCMASVVAQQEPAKPYVPPPKKSVPPEKAGLMDINSATEDQLKALPGVGDSIAKKIIAGRPYEQTDELVSKQIIPKELYIIIKERITALKGEAVSR
ncbi:MAG TPA: helix-hairpin-helix domain-containing protein [Geobacteraceae bacterium]|jgi:DNA uptake protein ComE-like DNA-binding protein|nr:helix-hairpin-helix domain-containing protein [Geobacteraceae bacterium]